MATYADLGVTKLIHLYVKIQDPGIGVKREMRKEQRHPIYNNTCSVHDLCSPPAPIIGIKGIHMRRNENHHRHISLSTFATSI